MMTTDTPNRIESDEPNLERRLAEAETKIVGLVQENERFRDKVIETTMEWDGGCVDGKLQFLDSLGLSPPDRTIRVSMTIKVDNDNYKEYWQATETMPDDLDIATFILDEPEREWSNYSLRNAGNISVERVE
jgi:hypothetical protein